MRIRILGSLEVEIAGSPIDIPGRREQMLLVRMALAPGETLSVDTLVDALWGEDLPAKPTNALQAAVSRLRKLIGKDSIVTRAPGYLLDIAPDAVDATGFANLLARADAAGDLDVRSALLGDALNLWRGPALSDFAGEDFTQRDIRRLSELHQRAVELRLAAEIDTGRHAAAIAELERLVVDNPLRESLRKLHMLALYRSGRQAEALGVYREIRHLLAEELGVDPGPELRELELQILEHAPELAPRPPGSSRRRAELTNLPVRLTSFIGRERETAAVLDALGTSRLVSLLGPGGSGKTSLCIEAGRHRVGEYPHGVWLVELAAAGPDDVCDTVSSVLGVDTGPGFGLGVPDAPDPAERVVNALRDRKTLLILDNCEHVIDIASGLAQAILLACPHVDIVATSRERLGIPGEVVHAVPSLTIGAPGEMAPAALMSADAIRLFGERAAAVNPEFRLDESNVHDVATICRRLDGLPLAIELAAARTASLPVSDIAVRIDDVFRLLTGGSRTAAARHQTLRATIGWSYTLLSRSDRSVFDRLSVFRGRFDLDAAAAVVDADEMDVLDVLHRLIDRSMLIAEPGERPAYRMLETLRAFGAEQLEDTGEADDAHRRHFDHYRAIVTAAEPHLRTGNQMQWMARLDGALENIRAAMDWSVAHDPIAGTGIAGELGWYSYLRGHRAEARARIGRLLESGGRDAPPLDLGKALFTYAMADPSPNLSVGDLDDARAQFEQAGDRWYAAVCAAIASTFRAFYGDVEAAMQIVDEAGAVMQELGDDWGCGLVEFFKANGATADNDFATTLEHVERAQAYFARSGDAWGVGYMEYFLGTIERSRGDYASAEATFGDALARARTLGLKHEIPVMMGELANIATLRGDYPRADAILNEAMEIADNSPFLGSQAMIHNARGLWWRHQGHNRRAYESHLLASQMYQDTAREGGVAFAQGSAGRAAEALGDLVSARSHHLASLDAALAIGDHPGVAFAAEGMAGVAIAAGQPAHGAVLLGAASRLREDLGLPLPPGEDFDVRRWRAAVAEDLSAAALDTALRRGADLDVDAIVTAVREAFDGLA